MRLKRFMRWFCDNLNLHWFVEKRDPNKHFYWISCRWCGRIRSGPR